jgi:hypothetical protein
VKGERKHGARLEKYGSRMEFKVKRVGKVYKVVDIGNSFVAEFKYLGEANEFINRHSPRQALTERRCMCCEKPFMSWGAGNRLCAYCRNDTGPEHFGSRVVGYQ